MTTKFDVGDIVEIKNQSISVRYEVIAIMTITSATENIRYEIRNTYGQKYIFEEDKLVKALMTKEEARNKARKELIKEDASKIALRDNIERVAMFMDSYSIFYKCAGEEKKRTYDIEEVY